MSSPLNVVPQENQLEQVRRTFFFRLTNAEESIDATDIEAGVLRGPDKRILSPDRVWRLFFDYLTSKEGLNLNKTIAYHFHDYYLKDFLDQIKDLNTRLKNNDTNEDWKVQRRSIQNTLVAEMRAFVKNPQAYGIVRDFQDDTWFDIIKKMNGDVTEDKAEYFTYQDLLESNLFQKGTDDEGHEYYVVNDPFHVNGQLPHPKVIGDACRRLIDKRFPLNQDSSVAERKGRMLLRDRLVGFLTSLLQDAVWPRKNLGLTQKQKAENVHHVLDQIATLMRQLIDDPDKPRQYVEAIYEGTKRPDLINLPSVFQALPYKIELMPEETESNRQAKRNAIYAHYQALPETYTDKELADLAEYMDNESNQFYRMSGYGEPKSNEHVLVDIIAVLKYKGISEDDINQHFVPLVLEQIRALSELSDQRNAAYQKGATDGRNTTEIDSLKQQIGEVRKKLVRRARNFAAAPALFHGRYNSADDDPLWLVVNDAVSLYSQERQIGANVEFICADLKDMDARIEALVRVQAQLTQMWENAANGPGSNSLPGNEDFILAKEKYEQAKQAFERFIRQSTESLELQEVDQQLNKVLILLDVCLRFYDEAKRFNEDSREGEVSDSDV